MPDTIRERCLMALKAQLQTIAVPAADADPMPDDPYSFTWSQVVRGPLGDYDAKKRYMCGIVEQEESKQTRYPLTDCTLRIAVEFHVTINRGDQGPSVEANRLLGEVQRCICANRTLGGIAIDLTEAGNELDLDSERDKAVFGTVFVLLKYRHATDDPRQAM